MPERLDAIVIAGPTASGKTGLAVKVAKLLGGPVINADSMQVYELLSVVTARPRLDEMGGVEHLLFAHVPPSEAYSVARYLDDLKPVLEKVSHDGRIPVLAGGTGLYFKSMMEGLAPVPEIEDDIRSGLRERSEYEPQALYEELKAADPYGAAGLKPGDTQRIVRALEVVLSTGKPLSWWQGQAKGEALISPDHCLKIVLLPDRELLRERISKRFEAMMEEGALEEVRSLLSLNLADSLPAMRAIGVKQLAGYVRGEASLDEAIELAIHATRQYAKRQSTWFRNQFLAASRHVRGDNPLIGWHEMDSADDAFELVKRVRKEFVNHNF